MGWSWGMMHWKRTKSVPWLQPALSAGGSHWLLSAPVKVGLTSGPLHLAFARTFLWLLLCFLALCSEQSQKVTS